MIKNELKEFYYRFNIQPYLFNSPTNSQLFLISLTQSLTNNQITFKKCQKFNTKTVQ